MIHPGVIINHEYTVVTVEGNQQGINDAIDWCRERFGPPGIRWFYKPHKFYFRDNRDAFWFELGT
jgi:hypothetical protein